MLRDTWQPLFFEVVQKDLCFAILFVIEKELRLDVCSTIILRNRVRNITWYFADVTLGQVCWN